MKKSRFYSVVIMACMIICFQLLSGCHGTDSRSVINKLEVKKEGGGAGTITSTPGGVECGNDCSQYYPYNEKVTLKAVPETGSEFSGWNGGGCSGTGDCTIALNGSVTVTAVFNKSPLIYGTRGNGLIFEISDDEYTMYEVTDKSLFPVAEGTITDNTMYYEGYKVDSLDFITSMSDRIDKLPQRNITAFTDDPIVNFEVFWSIFNENYSLFDLADLDWHEIYSENLAKITKDTTENELWEIFTEMITPLNDGHTMLLDFEGQRQIFSRPLETSPSYWMMENIDSYFDVITSYMDSFSMDENILGNGSMFYGKIGNRIGYINVLAYEGYNKDYQGPDDFSLLSILCSYTKEMEVFPGLMDNLFNEFADMDALVIDLRFNMGGSGDLVMEFTNRLVSEMQLAYTYRIRFGGYDDFDAPVPEYVEPIGVGFRNKPIIVLTSHNTVSGGDLQTMLLKGLPNVTIMGETTFGIFSEGIPRSLPNGWMVTLSTQRLFSPTGECFEQTGVSPDIEVSPEPDGLLNGSDNMLEQALSYIDM